MRSQAPVFGPSADDAIRGANRRMIFPLIGELGRVMEHKDLPIAGAHSITRRLKMPSQNVRLADAVIGEEAIGRLCVGPILANQRSTLTHGAPELRQQRAEPSLQSFVSQRAAGDLGIKPRTPRRVHRTAPESELCKESQAVRAGQANSCGFWLRAIAQGRYTKEDFTSPRRSILFVIHSRGLDSKLTIGSIRSDRENVIAQVQRCG